MLWQRTTKKDATVWIALDADLNRVKNGDGFYMIRYDPSAGAPIYLAKRGITLDKTSMPEELPDGVDANSREGIIRRFCFTDEARRDWDFLDAWKRRRHTSITHAGCGDSWPEIQPKIPLTCPRCGPLKGTETLYAQWQTVKDPDGEGVKAIVYEAWLTGKRFEYLRLSNQVQMQAATPTAPNSPLSQQVPTQAETSTASPSSLNQAGHEAPETASQKKSSLGIGLIIFLVWAFTVYGMHLLGWL